MAIQITCTLPDSNLQDSYFNKALVRVAMRLARLGPNDLQSRPPQLDVQFLLPGKFDKPGFEGMRLTRFEQDAQALVVESAVPPSLVDADYAEDYVIAVLQDAVENAASFFTEMGILFDESRYMALVDSITRPQAA